MQKGGQNATDTERLVRALWILASSGGVLPSSLPRTHVPSHNSGIHSNNSYSAAVAGGSYLHAGSISFGQSAPRFAGSNSSVSSSSGVRAKSSSLLLQATHADVVGGVALGVPSPALPWPSAGLARYVGPGRTPTRQPRAAEAAAPPQPTCIRCPACARVQSFWNTYCDSCLTKLADAHVRETQRAARLALLLNAATKLTVAPPRALGYLHNPTTGHLHAEQAATATPAGGGLRGYLDTHEAGLWSRARLSFWAPPRALSDPLTALRIAAHGLHWPELDSASRAAISWLALGAGRVAFAVDVGLSAVASRRAQAVEIVAAAATAAANANASGGGRRTVAGAISGVAGAGAGSGVGTGAASVAAGVSSGVTAGTGRGGAAGADARDAWTPSLIDWLDADPTTLPAATAAAANQVIATNSNAALEAIRYVALHRQCNIKV